MVHSIIGIGPLWINVVEQQSAERAKLAINMISQVEQLHLVLQNEQL